MSEGVALLQRGRQRLESLAPVRCHQLKERTVVAWCAGYGQGATDVLERLKGARRKMVETYEKKMEETTEKDAYHAAVATMAIEVETIIDEISEGKEW